MNTENIGIGAFGIVFGTIAHFVGNFYFAYSGGPVGYGFCQLITLIAIPAGLWLLIGGFLHDKNESKKSESRKDGISAIIASILFFIIGMYLLQFNLIVVGIFSGFFLIIGIANLLS